MSIVKMKRLRLIALARDRDGLMAGLLHAGCVEISEPEEPADTVRLRRDTGGLAAARTDMTELTRALDTLRRYAPQKSGLLSPRPAVRESDILNPAARNAAVEKARRINERAKTIGQLAARESRLRAEALSLTPWVSCDVPLENTGTKTVARMLGTVPSAVDMSAVEGALAEAADCAVLTLLSSNAEQHCLELLVHTSQETAALECLRSFGFGYAQLKDMAGTAGDNLKAIQSEIAQVEREKRQEADAIAAMGPDTAALKTGVDQVQQVINTEAAKERLLTGGAVVCLDGWVDVPHVPALEKLLNRFDCAWELTDPTPEEYPVTPVKLKNGAFSRCMNTVTEMYSLPAYDGVDPNPLMAPFFILFFGVMMADMAYGLLMIIASAVYLRKARPKNPAFMEMIFWCGISTFIVGALTGGFFGDFIPQLLTVINPNSTFEMPALLSPLDDIVTIMIGSLILGLIQIFTGMGISVSMKVKSGDFIDALFSEITWWIILGGLAMMLVGMMVPGVPAALGTVGKAVLIIGGLMLVVGGTRNAKGFGKVTSLVGLIYNGVTGYFSDILSYIRLMALMVSGSVIASVFNTLGATFGNVVLFVIIAMVGNALNLALNLLGCYVHDLRLQCLEFFGRFYKEGGKPYKPLAIDTKYVEVIKEEH